MSKVTIYQFTVYEITSDGNIRSRRWGTREGIKAVGGALLENTATEVEADLVGSEIEGLTARNFDPHPRVGFPNQVLVAPRP